MPALPSNGLINAAGDWDITIPKPAAEYVLTVTGTWNGGTVTISRYKPAIAAYKPISGGVLSADFEERAFVPDATGLRFSVTGTPTLEVTLIQRS